MISAFAFGGIPAKAVQKAFAEADIYVSSGLLNEYRNIPLELLSESKITHLQFEALITGIAAFVSVAKMVFPRRRLTICRDPKDNMVIECCLEAKAGWLLTGDKDLLDLENLPFALKILSARAYLDQRQ